MLINLFCLFCTIIIVRLCHVIFIRRYIFFKHGASHHNYCVAAAAVFIFGWMHTIAYVKLFKDWHAFANIFKRIVAKDVTKFAYIYVFVLLR